MSISEYKEKIAKPLKPRTVTFLLKEGNVLLGHKKRGFGKGNFIGIGGKVEESKDKITPNQSLALTIKNGACREILEEIGSIVVPENLRPQGVLRFYFPDQLDESWNQEVYIFTATQWKNEPYPKKDSDGEIEIEPKWIPANKLPLDHMWDDAQYWLPLILQGKNIEAEFVFNDDLKVVDHNLIFK